MLKKYLTHAVGAFLFVAIFVSAVVFTGFGNDREFSSDLWLRSDARTRGRMAESLVANHSFVGKTADEVTASLGVPDRDWGRVHQYKIDLGWPFKDPNTYGLQVHYDADGNVQLVKVVD